MAVYVGTTMEDIRDCNAYIVTVPTDINKDKTPNLEPLRNASETHWFGFKTRQFGYL